MKWISVNDRLPVIPDGKFAVPVLVAVFDEIFHNLSLESNGYSVESAMYSKIDDRLKAGFWEGFTGDRDFTTRVYPTGEPHPFIDEVTHWMYMPAPPEVKDE